MLIKEASKTLRSSFRKIDVPLLTLFQNALAVFFVFFKFVVWCLSEYLLLSGPESFVSCVLSVNIRMKIYRIINLVSCTKGRRYTEGVQEGGAVEVHGTKKE